LKVTALISPGPVLDIEVSNIFRTKGCNECHGKDMKRFSASKLVANENWDVWVSYTDPWLKCYIAFFFKLIFLKMVDFMCGGIV
jgi:hypothetical protein